MSSKLAANMPRLSNRDLLRPERFSSAPGTPCRLRRSIDRSRSGRSSAEPTWRARQHHRHNYGQLLILNAGGGYHVLLAGMERISVDLGQFVLTGEPVAVMGDGAQSAVAKAGGVSQPVLYVEFRKDGVPVDPGPWWAVNEGQKVRG